MDSTIWNSIFGNKPPTITYCETAIDQVIARPGYFVSAFAYLFVGIYLLFIPGKLSKWFALFTLGIAFSSALYDASYRFDAQTLDLFMIFAFVVFIMILNLIKLGYITKQNASFVTFLTTLVLLTSVPLIRADVSMKIPFAIFVISVFVAEYLVFRKKEMPTYKYFYWAFGILVVGFFIYMLDYLQLWCSPNVLFNGRALYHYITAVAVFFLYKHNELKFRS